MSVVNMVDRQDPLRIERDLTRTDCETLIAAMLPVFRPRSVEAFEALVNSRDRSVRALERDLLTNRIEVNR